MCLEMNKKQRNKTHQSANTNFLSHTLTDNVYYTSLKLLKIQKAFESI